jgi:hypothetical protein
MYEVYNSIYYINILSNSTYYKSEVNTSKLVIYAVNNGMYYMNLVTAHIIYTK